MAPEVKNGVDYDCSADLWSVGIVAIECAQRFAPLMEYAPMNALEIICSNKEQSSNLEDPEGIWLTELHNFVNKIRQEPQGKTYGGNAARARFS